MKRFLFISLICVGGVVQASSVLNKIPTRSLSEEQRLEHNIRLADILEREARKAEWREQLADQGAKNIKNIGAQLIENKKDKSVELVLEGLDGVETVLNTIESSDLRR